MKRLYDLSFRLLRRNPFKKDWIPARFAGANARRAFAGMTIFLLFSFFLMFHTFGYDNTDKNILIARTIWSDFGSHIPLIRSFSTGDNFDRMMKFQIPEYPLFSGEPIRYHFLFYMVVGLLEKLGLRLDWALNLPSILGFTLLLWGIWSLAFALFQDKKVAFLSIIFFLFNGSLSFLKFFSDHPLSLDTPLDIIRANAFPAFGPWDGGMISAFWNLNIYTNQRHLAVAFAVTLLFIRWVARNSKFEARSTKQIQNSKVQNSKRSGFRIWNLGFVSNFGFCASDLREAVAWGLVIGLFPWFHQPSLLIFAVLLTWYFLAFPLLRKSIFVISLTAALLTLPQLMSIFARHPGLDPGSIFSKLDSGPLRLSEASSLAGMTTMFRSLWFPGYLIFDRLTLPNFLSFWIQNLGLHAILIPVGFFLLPKHAQKILLPALFLFIIGNLFKFSMEIAANHKFFNFALIIGNMISAYMLVTVFINNKVVIPGLTRNPSSFFSLIHWHIISFIGRIGVLVGLVGLLTLSGFIDFFVIANDTKGTLADVGNDQTSSWIAANTPKDAVFLNSSFLYHPASLAGRRIFMGWPYFAWSAGYDTYRRNDEMKVMYESRDPKVFCPLLKQYNISYVTVEDTKGDPNLPMIDLNYFHDSFQPVFKDSEEKIWIYQTSALCP
ncbi:hypothetical protein HY949_04135 [Candidatus Gottesmanbacteria bacterium]|nr:hypothetical protein [Candidatus Gottesmanbacteria bacterium]